MNPEFSAAFTHPETAPADPRPMITLITPAFNESAIIQQSLGRLCDFMRALEHRFRWEIVVVNDGSRDQTGRLADEFAEGRPQVRVIHHTVNRNLGVAMQTGFRHAQGDYIIVLDLDLSYSPEEHIVQLMDTILETEADIVVASPYMKGGKNTAVPTGRLIMSKVVNWLMRVSAGKNIYTFTSMVRVYNGNFIKNLNLKSGTYDINPEILFKALILRARIVEIPGHLDWSFQKEQGKGRTSSMRILKGILGGLMTGFIFRPYMFFLVMGTALFALAMYILLWVAVHTVDVYGTLQLNEAVYNTRFSQAIAEVFRERPHAFFVGGIALVVALQFWGIGFLSLQSKRYFDELFHITSAIKRRLGEPDEQGHA